MPAFNQVALLRHGQALKDALDDLSTRAQPGGRPVPPILFAHADAVSNALLRLHEQLSVLRAGDLVVASRGGGAVRAEDVAQVARWWSEGGLSGLLSRTLTAAVRDVSIIACQAPGGPAAAEPPTPPAPPSAPEGASWSTPSRNPSRGGDSVQSYPGAAGWAGVDPARSHGPTVAFEGLLSDPRAVECTASMAVLHGVLQVVIDAVQLLRARPPASLTPPPPVPPPPELGEAGVGREGSASEAGPGPGSAQDAAGSSSAPDGGAGRGGGYGRRAVAGGGRAAAAAVASRSVGGAGGAAGSPRVRGPAAAGAAGFPPAPAAQPSGSPAAQNGALLPPIKPPRVGQEQERYQKALAKQMAGERQYVAWSALQDAVLDLICNSPLLLNLTELLRHCAALLALPGGAAGGGSGPAAAPRVAALWRQAWSMVPLVAALAHALIDAAATSLMPAAAAAAGAGGGATDQRTAAIMLTALADSALIAQCCDAVLSVHRAALTYASTAPVRHCVGLAAGQLLAAVVILCLLAEAGGAMQPPPPPSSSGSDAGGDGRASGGAKTPLEAAAAAVSAVLSNPAVQYLVCERQASAMAQAYGELASASAAAAAAAASAAAAVPPAVTTSWALAPELAGAPPPEAPTAAADGAAPGGSSAGVPPAAIHAAARACGLDLLPVPALPWVVPVEEATSSIPDVGVTQLATEVAAAARARSALMIGGLSIDPLVAEATSPAGAASPEPSANPSSPGGGGSGGKPPARRRRDGASPEPSASRLRLPAAASPRGSSPASPAAAASPYAASAAAFSAQNLALPASAGAAAAPKLPPLRLPIKAPDADTRRRAAQRTARMTEALTREAEVLALVRATTSAWRWFMSVSAAPPPPPASYDDGEYGEYDGYGAGRPETPLDQVPSASRALVQLAMAAAVCRAAVAPSDSPAVAAAVADGGGSSGGGAATPGGGDEAAEREERLAALLAVALDNLAAATEACPPAERAEVHDRTAPLLAAALGAAQDLLARSPTPDVSTPLVGLAEAVLTWLAEADASRAAEAAALERQLTEAELAAAEAEVSRAEEEALAAAEERGFHSASWDEGEGEDAGPRGPAAAAAAREHAAAAAGAAAAAVSRAAATRVAAAARDAGRLVAGAALAEGSVRFLLSHHATILQTLATAGLLRRGLQLRPQHTRHTELLRQTLSSLAHIAGRCATAVAEAAAPRPLHATLASTPSASGAPPQPAHPAYPVAFAAASHAAAAAAVAATYTPVTRALHSAFLTVRKGLALCEQQVSSATSAAANAAASGAGVGLQQAAAAAEAEAAVGLLELQPVGEVCAALCGFPGLLAAEVWNSHQAAAAAHAQPKPGSRSGSGPGAARDGGASASEEGGGGGSAAGGSEAVGSEEGGEEEEEEEGAVEEEGVEEEGAVEEEGGSGVEEEEGPEEEEAVADEEAPDEDGIPADKIEYNEDRGSDQDAEDGAYDEYGYQRQAPFGLETILETSNEVSTAGNSTGSPSPQSTLPRGKGHAAKSRLGAAAGARASEGASVDGVEDEGFEEEAVEEEGSEAEGEGGGFQEEAVEDEDQEGEDASAEGEEEGATESGYGDGEATADGTTAGGEAAAAAAPAKPPSPLPLVARAVASASLHTTVPAAWRLFAALFVSLARQELSRPTPAPAPQPLPPVAKSRSLHVDGEPSQASSPGAETSAASATDGGTDGGGASSLTEAQRTALLRTASGLWELLHSLLAVQLAGAPWPAAVFQLPPPLAAQLAEAARELRKPRQPHALPPPPPLAPPPVIRALTPPAPVPTPSPPPPEATALSPPAGVVADGADAPPPAANAEPAAALGSAPEAAATPQAQPQPAPNVAPSAPPDLPTAEPSLSPSPGLGPDPGPGSGPGPQSAPEPEAEPEPEPEPKPKPQPEPQPEPEPVPEPPAPIPAVAPAESVREWREALALLDQVSELNAAWAELQVAEGAAGGAGGSGGGALGEPQRPSGWRVSMANGPAGAGPGPGAGGGARGPSAAEMLASFMKEAQQDARGISRGSLASPALAARRRSGSGVAAAPLGLLLGPAEAARVMAGLPPGVGGAGDAMAADAAAAALGGGGCAFAGCVRMAGCSEVASGRAVACVCGRVSYCSAGCLQRDAAHQAACRGQLRSQQQQQPFKLGGLYPSRGSAGRAVGGVSAGGAGRPAARRR
ncbi:hypothetical protein HYH03_011978 [Edaphochlamys debaryana]|uniref:Uncharacterized protein n=1 Tax=Edaphochlamys debaryana TaxID=47281 RepID=A0A835XQZ7_9CHLO|nr:hypothetical protein HYH03_011978 [Edaphochlamys debaryana]|eukprot:KAG2489527.1 hypothetical protein HYH03_011978 [Edaphochlamys debaryana]